MAGEPDRRLSPLFSWRSAICDSDLPATSRHVALTLSLHMNERGGSCFPAVNTLSYETGLGSSTIRQHLNELAAKGWLKLERRDGTSNVYQATIPDDGPLQELEAPPPGAAPPPPGAGGPSKDVTEGVKEDVSSSRSSEPSKSKKDQIWDALALAAGVEVSGLTKSARSDFAKTVNELVDAGAEPAQLAAFARWWRETYQAGPNPATLTHRCFRQHWPAFLGARIKQVARRAAAERRPAPEPPVTPEQRRRNVERVNELAASIGGGVE